MHMVGTQYNRSSKSGGGGTFRYCLVMCLPEGSLSVVIMMTSLPLALQASSNTRRASLSPALTAYTSAEEPEWSSKLRSAPLDSSWDKTSSPARSTQACIRAVLPDLSWIFGSAPFSSRYLWKRWNCHSIKGSPKCQIINFQDLIFE